VSPSFQQIRSNKTTLAFVYTHTHTQTQLLPNCKKEIIVYKAKILLNVAKHQMRASQ